jgi:heat shock protein HtpX
MSYVGIETQQRRNNILSILLLILFPVILLGIVWLFFFLITYFGSGVTDDYGNTIYNVNWETVNYYFVNAVPWVIGFVIIWFLIAYFSNTSMIRMATGAKPLDRKENPRIYNIVENLCMTCGMNTPKINIVDDPQLNAFASGIDEKSYTVTLTTGIISRLSDDELAGVIGHELTHIRNHDTRLLITSIIFVGIVATMTSIAVRMIYNMFLFGGGGRRDDDKKENGLSVVAILLIAVVCCAVGYLFTALTRFAISRKREYMADAGGAELCGNPLALASALRKISSEPGLSQVNRDDVAQLFIIHPKDMTQGFMNVVNSLFSTHPSTEKRIQILEQF